MKLGTIFLGLLLLLCAAFPARANQISKAEDSTGILWVHILPGMTDDDGNAIPEHTQSMCSFWNLQKVKGGYIGITAAHCFEIPKEYAKYVQIEASYGQPTLGEKQVFDIFSGPETEYYFVAPKNFADTTLLEKGDPNKADDLAIFFVKTKEKHATLKLADSSQVKTGDKVINVSQPMGDAIDKGLYEGIVSNPSVNAPEDPATDKHIHISMLGPGPGSSGSAVIDKKLNGVIGILVVQAGYGQFILVPSNTLSKFIKDHKLKKS